MRKKLKNGGSYADWADVIGEVVEADLRQRQFQLSRQWESPICVDFLDSQEDAVTTALREHKWARLRVQGQGEYSKSGELLRITRAEQLTLLARSPDGSEPVLANRSIEEIAEEIASKIPDSEWEKLPKDLCDQIDHYAYGTPKRPKQ